MHINRKKILIVDDDETHLFVTRELLRDDGFEILTHQSGFGVMEVVSEFQPDLVLLDVNMPALPGDKLAVLLRDGDQARALHIVFYSSHDEDRLKECAADCGAQGYICKGDIADLRKKIDRYLG